MSSADQPVPVRLALSLWFFLLANSEICCYFMVFLNQIKSASVVSLPLPLMVFLWGTLTIPRPTKTFWVTMIAYVEVSLVSLNCWAPYCLWVQLNYMVLLTKKCGANKFLREGAGSNQILEWNYTNVYFSSSGPGYC